MNYIYIHGVLFLFFKQIGKDCLFTAQRSSTVNRQQAYCPTSYAHLSVQCNIMHSLQVTLLSSLCCVHSWCHFVDVILLIILLISLCCWKDILLNNICMVGGGNYMTKTTQPFLPALSTWSLKSCHITSAGIANNGRHYKVIYFLTYKYTIIFL